MKKLKMILRERIYEKLYEKGLDIEDLSYKELKQMVENLSGEVTIEYTELLFGEWEILRAFWKQIKDDEEEDGS